MTERLWLSPEAVQQIISFATAAVPEETGGVLMGYVTLADSRGRRDAVVTDLIGPGPGARASPTSFEPDSAWQIEQIEKVYRRHNRRVSYLGDWHTHPGGRAMPSRRDKDTLASIAAYSPARCPEPIMAILGGDLTHGFRLGVSQYVKTADSSAKFGRPSARVRAIRWRELPAHTL